MSIRNNFSLPGKTMLFWYHASSSQWDAMHVAIIADDLTGAADTGVQFARAGYRTAVGFRHAPIPPAEDLDAVALDTDSRALPAGFAAKRVLKAARAVRSARVVYKK